MPTEDSTTRLGYAFCVVFRPSVGDHLASTRSRPSGSVDELADTMLDEYNDAQNAASSHTTRPVVDAASLEEPIHLGSQSVEGDQATITSPEPISTPTAPIHNTPPDLEGPPRPAADGQHLSNGRYLIPSNLARRQVALIVVGVLLLVVVPGLTLGLVTGEIEWGIALSGAVVSVVGVFVGLYYHNRK